MFSCTYNEPARSLASVNSRPTPDSAGCVPALACAAVRSSTSYVIFLEPVSVRAAPVWPPSAQHRGLWKLLCDVLPCTTSPACRPLPCACLRRKPPLWRVRCCAPQYSIHLPLGSTGHALTPLPSLSWRRLYARWRAFFWVTPAVTPRGPIPHVWARTALLFLCDARHRPQPPPPARASVQGRAGGGGWATGARRSAGSGHRVGWARSPRGRHQRRPLRGACEQLGGVALASGVPFTPIAFAGIHRTSAQVARCEPAHPRR